MNADAIRYVHRDEIDNTKWNDCIKRTANSRLYAYSFYLDAMSKQWDALVLGDYKAVMALPWNSKYGIRYIYQPFITAQLGVFGEHITPELANEFIRSIPVSFRLVEISLNPGHQHAVSSTPRKNYVLNLEPVYETIAGAYNENTRRNIKKAMQLGLSAITSTDPEKVIALALEQMKSHGEEPADNLDRFRKLYHALEEKGMTRVYGIGSTQKELLASAIFFIADNRAYYMLVGNHPSGRTSGASHALVDAFIKDHAGKKMVLDFEGSDIPTLASFYSGFGAVNEPYSFLKINRLPFYLKWMKR